MVMIAAPTYVARARACGRDYCGYLSYCNIVAEDSSFIATIEKMARNFCVSLVISVVITLARVQGTSSKIYNSAGRIIIAVKLH